MVDYLLRDLVSGTLSAQSLTAATTMTSAVFAALPVVAAPDIMWLTADPDATLGAPEIVKITAHSAASTTVTVTRAQGGTTARDHGAGTKVVAGLVKAVFDEIETELADLRTDLDVAARVGQGFAAGKDATQSISAGNAAFITWTNQQSDEHDWHVANSSLITLPFTGFYTVRLYVDLDSGDIEAYRYRINSNTPGSGGTELSLTIGDPANNIARIESGQGNTSLHSFNANDEFRVEAKDATDGVASVIGTGTTITIVYNGF